MIAVSSIHAILGESNYGHYTTAKGGMESFCRTLARRSGSFAGGLAMVVTAGAVSNARHREKPLIATEK